MICDFLRYRSGQMLDTAMNNTTITTACGALCHRVPKELFKENQNNLSSEWELRKREIKLNENEWNGIDQLLGEDGGRREMAGLQW
jgi:hypothetical protein